MALTGGQHTGVHLTHPGQDLSAKTDHGRVRGCGQAPRLWPPLQNIPPPPSFQDNHPLASLPLLGYSLTIPSESKDIHKDYVFKLHFKSHVYYFRAESEYTFER